MRNWHIVLIALAALYLISLGVYSYLNREGEWVATVLDTGEVVADGNRCKVLDKAGYSTVICK